MAKIKQKGKSGAAVNYITRNQAIKKLQVTLADFRRLCILKGIYPREPKNKKKANKGSTAPATFYYTKDIQYLLHEPLIQKFRDHKIFVRKLGKALGKGQTSVVKNLQENKPVYTLDHIVKERYPSFTDALRDLDDALCMIFLFANSPATDKVQRESVKECRRLSAEFQHYVMQTSSLRKVFLSIKGIYYQCEIKGQTISWLVPYQFSQDVPTDVDFRVMNSFLEFYQTLIGFVNYKLYTDENLVYPPKFDKSKEDGGAGLDAYVLESASAVNMEITPEPQEEVQKPVQESVKKSEKRLGSLAQKIANIKDNSASESRVEVAKEEDTIDEFPQELNQEGKVFSLNDVKAASNALSALQSLFSNQVIFLSREVPKYSLEFVIKAFGGKVGWDSSVAAGSPFDENDARITVQICDRPVQGHMFLSRV
ncbi:mRNA-binding ribosome synthesis protein nop7 [Basidiobolus ranarum]|uniref:mRNA-binding ribosome synthesis protein nop7 n=1 Tax=Basidiobolus ranarum TaxID=34480 RepID=A0ABR2VW94_9FUNG